MNPAPKELTSREKKASIPQDQKSLQYLFLQLMLRNFTEQSISLSKVAEEKRSQTSKVITLRKLLFLLIELSGRYINSHTMSYPEYGQVHPESP